MNHDTEQLAAAYLATMRPRARRRFEAHLLACELCWQEVTLARHGRRLAESARDVGPAALREDIRATIAAAAAQPAAGPPPRRRSLTVAVAAAALAAAIAVLARPWPDSAQRPGGGAQPAVIAAALISYHMGRLPGTAVPAAGGPRLSNLHLRMVAAAAGQLHGVAVTMFVYRTSSGARLAIFSSSQPFPEGTEARELGGTSDAWTMRLDGVTVICAQGTHAMLLLGSDAALVRQVGALLDAI